MGAADDRRDPRTNTPSMFPVFPATLAAFIFLEMRFSWQSTPNSCEHSLGVWGTGVRLREHTHLLPTVAQRALQLCMSAAPFPAVATLSGQIASCNCPAVCFAGFVPGSSSENLVTDEFIHFPVSCERIFHTLYWLWLTPGISSPNFEILPHFSLFLFLTLTLFERCIYIQRIKNVHLVKNLKITCPKSTEEVGKVSSRTKTRTQGPKSSVLSRP